MSVQIPKCPRFDGIRKRRVSSLKVGDFILWPLDVPLWHMRVVDIEPTTDGGRWVYLRRLLRSGRLERRTEAWPTGMRRMVHVCIPTPPPRAADEREGEQAT